MSDIDPKAKSLELIASLKKGKSTYDHFAISFHEHYSIAGKSLKLWEVEFKITIPEDLNPTQCKTLDLKLMELHQEAAFYKATARAILQALKKGSETEFRNRFTALVQEYKNKGDKLPAAATLESLARMQIDDVDAALMSATIANNFWEDIIEHLVFCRKLVENMIMASGIEVKMQNNHKGNIY